MLRSTILLALFVLSLPSKATLGDWTDFTLKNGHITIPVTVSGIDTFAILDTGAQINGINQAFINKHKLDFANGRKINIQGVFGKEKKQLKNNIPISIFGFDVELDGAAPMSFGHHSNGLLIGAGFFNRFIVQIDYPNSKMRVLPRQAVNLEKVQNLKTNKQKGSGQPLVRLNFPNDRSIWVLLDTGNSGGLVVERRIANVLDLDLSQSTASVNAGVNSIAITETFSIPELQFGPFVLEDVIATVPAEGQKVYVESQYSKTGTRIKSKKMQGILGYDLLKHFVLTLDYRTGRAHIAVPE